MKPPEAKPSTKTYEAFRRKYFDDPQGFILHCIDHRDDEPAPYQLEIARELPEQRRVAVRGPHGLGKTALAAWLILWFALTRDGLDWKCVTTASAWRQLTKFLWPEVHKWARRVRWDRVGRLPFDTGSELQVLSLKLETGEAMAVASNNADYIEGAHADHMLYVYDEAKAIPEATFDAAEGAFSTGQCYALAISTPSEPLGRFYDIHSRKVGYSDWWVRWVTKEEALSASRMLADWIEKRRVQWGENSAVYLNRVEGQFATSDTVGIIPLSWVELANARWHEWTESLEPDLSNVGEFTGIGVDVSLGIEDGDNVFFALCFDYQKILELRLAPVVDLDISLMETAAKVMGILDKWSQGEAIVDVVGIGAGVLHRLRERGYMARGFSAGRATEFLDRSGELGFANWRSAGWWMMREMLDPNSGFEIALPPSDNLLGELTSPKYRVTSGGKASGGVIQVESKESIKKRLRRSTDEADAVIQIIVGPLLCDEWDAGQDQQSVVTYNPQQIGY